MNPARLLIDARTAAGLSQRDLAARSGTVQSVIARIECGQTSPTWATLTHLVESAALTLEARVRTATPAQVLDNHAIALLLQLTPSARLSWIEPEPATATSGHASRSETRAPGAPPVRLDATRLISVLSKHRVRHVLVGAAAARLYGAPRPTTALDIVPATDGENTARIVTALQELGARLFVHGVPDGVPYAITDEVLTRANRWRLTTVAGGLDVCRSPLGVDGPDALAAGAERFWIENVPVAVASLSDLIRMKDAVDRPSDRADIEVLRVLRSRRAKG